MSAHISGGYAKEPPTYGKVLLKTSVGDIDIELWPKQAPKACRNFIQLIMEHYYDDCIFHRVIPNFIAQTGDPTGTGQGGESAYGIPFKDEFHSRLTFSHRGIVAMANSGVKNENKSQFFISLDKCDWLNRKHTIFGKVTGNTVYNILEFNDLEIDKERNDRPLRTQKIHSVEILLNPFEDIKPRLDKIQSKSKGKNEAKTAKLERKNKLKAMGAKNDTQLLAFGDEDSSDGEQNYLLRTNEKLQKLKSARKTSVVSTPISDINKKRDNSNKSMDLIRAKLANKKRTFSELNKESETETETVNKKRKIESGGVSNEEYERLKKELLQRQKENSDTIASVSVSVEEECVSTVSDRLRQERERYIRQTRMSKKERNKFTLNKLNEFMDTIQSSDINKGNAYETSAKKKGKLDTQTGIHFCETQSGEDNSNDYDPDWFRHKLEFKRRPQDIEIYSVDDYCTIYGNSKQNIEGGKDRKGKNDRKKEREGTKRKRDYHNRDRHKRRDYSERNRR